MSAKNACFGTRFECMHTQIARADVTFCEPATPVSRSLFSFIGPQVPPYPSVYTASVSLVWQTLCANVQKPERLCTCSLKRTTSVLSGISFVHTPYHVISVPRRLTFSFLSLPTHFLLDSLSLNCV
ncbi:unnamed protein product [Protopolystoma xenopodis]|uniref:Uncharacterized protein n=1 Tax=Protopolystoma xenopodis TaxID=117903 RepID=A0A448XD81_9PLAT|nr:unnamed protein product [Protopolystoma xenopodis]